MSKLEWLDKVEQLSATWKDQCNLVSPTNTRNELSRKIFEAVWRFNEWDLKILRECLEDHLDWMLFDAHQRLKLEGILRGYWIEECAADDRLKNLFIVDKKPSLGSLKFKTRENFPNVPKMISDLKCKNVPYIAQRSKYFVSLYDGANDTAHMSLQLILSPLVVERKMWPEIRECLYQVGVCAIRISRISWDKSHVRNIENEFIETLKQLDSKI